MFWLSNIFASISVSISVTTEKNELTQETCIAHYHNGYEGVVMQTYIYLPRSLCAHEAGDGSRHFRLQDEQVAGHG